MPQSAATVGAATEIFLEEDDMHLSLNGRSIVALVVVSIALAVLVALLAFDHQQILHFVTSAGNNVGGSSQRAITCPGAPGC
jgi:hypothetical protein